MIHEYAGDQIRDDTVYAVIGTRPNSPYIEYVG